MRKLASIQRITAIDPIVDADNIEVASVLGWKVVVRKDEFRVGDLAIYMEIDSIPPDKPEYAFLWKNVSPRPDKYRIKTVRLRGQISQGILFSLNTLSTVDFLAVVEGADFTERLGVTKYEAPLPQGSNDVCGPFFEGVPKTDEERVQSELGMSILEELQGQSVYITVKCDGSSMTIAMPETTDYGQYLENLYGEPRFGYGGKVGVASRNWLLTETPSSAYWRAAHANNDALIDLVVDQPWLAVQGELVGPGIQGNRLGLTEHKCLVFDIYHRNEGRYLSIEEIETLAETWGFSLVPLIDKGIEFSYTVEDLLYMAEGKYDGTNNEREGIVIRSMSGKRLSIKAISNRFLLKGGE